MLSIDDVVKIDDKRKQIRKEIYMKIYTQFLQNKQSVELGHKQLFMTIPTFLIGYPVFDRSAAARYVARQFTLGGFTVQLVSDYDIYVTWSKPKKKKEFDRSPDCIRNAWELGSPIGERQFTIIGLSNWMRENSFPREMANGCHYKLV